MKDWEIDGVGVMFILRTEILIDSTTKKLLVKIRMNVLITNIHLLSFLSTSINFKFLTHNIFSLPHMKKRKNEFKECKY